VNKDVDVQLRHVRDVLGMEVTPSAPVDYLLKEVAQLRRAIVGLTEAVEVLAGNVISVKDLTSETKMGKKST
jgi:predicted RNA-binding protein with EMAP domain